jgi:hypothetical protein
MTVNTTFTGASSRSNTLVSLNRIIGADSVVSVAIFAVWVFPKAVMRGAQCKPEAVVSVSIVQRRVGYSVTAIHKIAFHVGPAHLSGSGLHCGAGSLRPLSAAFLNWRCFI